MAEIASQLTVEMPGALPELAASAQYNPFEAFTSRANVMQAWSGSGLLWTVVNDLLGVTPDAPAGSVAVVPEVPSSWPSMSVGNLHVGASTLDETASRHCDDYRRAGPAPDHRHGAGGGRDGALGHPERRARGVPAGDHEPRDRGRGLGTPS